MIYQTLDAVGDALVEATGNETVAMFEQGRIIIQAVSEGFDVDTITRHCAGLIRRTARTLYSRYSVARTFPEPHPELTFEFHRIAANLVDYRQTDETTIANQQEQARKWLDIAAAENYSTRTLKAAIRATGGKVEEKPQVIFDGARATILEEEFGNVLRLQIQEDVDLLELPLTPGTNVEITLVLKPLSVEAAMPDNARG